MKTCIVLLLPNALRHKWLARCLTSLTSYYLNAFPTTDKYTNQKYLVETSNKEYQRAALRKLSKNSDTLNVLSISI